MHVRDRMHVRRIAEPVLERRKAPRAFGLDAPRQDGEPVVRPRREAKNLRCVFGGRFVAVRRVMADR